MPDLVDYATPLARPDLEKSRVGGLMAFGVISIVAAAALVLIGGLGVVGILISAWASRRAAAAGAPTPPGFPILPMIGAMLMMTLLAAALVWLGIGSIRRRRWARPLILALAWFWFVTGVLGTISFAIANVVIPTQATSTTPAATAPTTATQPAAVPTTMPRAVAIFSLVFMTLFAVLLPLAYILFYRSPHVRRTLDAYDPLPRWTDRCPTPVLAVSVWCVLLAMNTLMGALSNQADLFGNYLTGVPAAGITAVKLLMLAAAAILCFRRSMIGWWIAFAYLLIWGTSLAVTWFVGDVTAIRGTAQSIGDEDSLHPAVRRATGVIYALGVLAAIAYLLYVRRWFNPAKEIPHGAVAGA